MARITLTLVDVYFTILSTETVEALANVVVNLVNTFSSIHALVCGTFVYVRFTELSFIARRIAIAMESTEFIDT